MNTLVFVSVMLISQTYGEAKSDSVDKLSTQQQKEWLLAHLMVDLRFDERKITVWEKRLNDMTPTQVAVITKAYILKREKKRQQEEQNQAARIARIQLQKQSYWYKSYYKYRYSNYTSYNPGYGYNWGYPLRPIYIGRLYR